MGAKLNVIGRAHGILGLPRRSISKNVSNLLKQRTGSCKSAWLTILEPACRSESIYSPHRRNESHRKLTFENPDAREILNMTQDRDDLRICRKPASGASFATK